jgi:hypothetical protein
MNSNSLINNLCENCVLLCTQILIPFGCATFLIKTVSHWPPLYASKNYSYSIMTLLPKTKTFWSNSPSSFAINNYFSPLIFPYLLTPIMMITIVEFQLWRELLNSLIKSTWKNMGTNSSSKMMMVDTMSSTQCNDNMHVTFLKSPLGFWLNAKKINLHKHAFW